MTLPSSGAISANDINVELQRLGTAAFSMNGTTERNLAKVYSGPISFNDFLGKTRETIVVLTTRTTRTRLDTLFTGPDWAANGDKIVNVPNGVTVAGLYVLNGTTPAWGGRLIVDIDSGGSVQGLGGVANSGIGGDAIYSNMGGTSTLFITNDGTIKAGGGGGGAGGQGGPGTYNINRDPASGGNFSYNSEFNFMEEGWQVGGGSLWVVMNGVTVYGPASSGPSYIDYGGYRYYPYAYQGSIGGNDYYSVYRDQPGSSSGGAGGAGGRGQGGDGANAGGSAGAAGGTNAGSGGSGGNGGTFANSGNAGSTGNAGNAGAGVAGSAGGVAGKTINGYNRFTYSGSGTLTGATANT